MAKCERGRREEEEEELQAQIHPKGESNKNREEKLCVGGTQRTQTGGGSRPFIGL